MGPNQISSFNKATPANGGDGTPGRERRVAGGSLNAPGLSRSGNEFPVVQVHLTYKVVEFVPSPHQDSSP